jgi:hypothetical protein
VFCAAGIGIEFGSVGTTVVAPTDALVLLKPVGAKSCCIHFVFLRNIEVENMIGVDD